MCITFFVGKPEWRPKSRCTGVKYAPVAGEQDKETSEPIRRG